ncbi:MULTISPECIES: hypothetical protein [unclassified Thiocapsa]|uniref:hypothetical protein n=1 Tax=unclassified Thiocapsa TaxID=2641286 RepID=UPI0035AE96A3
MKLCELETAVLEHGGEFLCERIHNENETKFVRFTHSVDPPGGHADLPAVGRLGDFYETFGSILFYHDDKSGDAGKYIAHPSQWEDLHGAFSAWIEDLAQEERDECVPAWVRTCLVIGETPQSGNYILVPIEGPEVGHVFEFDHDGFEFKDEAEDVVEYVKKLLKPDSSTLSKIASHMRFIEGDPMVQWWIRELRDNEGHIVRTNA